MQITPRRLIVAAAAVVVFRVLQFWVPLVSGVLVSWWLRQRSPAGARAG